MTDTELLNELEKRAEAYHDKVKKDFAIEELEKIKEEILKKVWRDAQGQIVTRDGFNHGIITSTNIIDNHISELKGE